jgi:hypothetical protein
MDTGLTEKQKRHIELLDNLHVAEIKDRIDEWTGEYIARPLIRPYI